MVAASYGVVDALTEYELLNRRNRDVRHENWGSTPNLDSVWAAAPKTATAEKKTAVVNSRIRVLLSRPLTWAEREAMETDTDDFHSRRINYVSKLSNDTFRLWVSPNGLHVWVEGSLGSRLAYQLVADVLETEFVNIYPRAVRTFSEFNGE